MPVIRSQTGSVTAELAISLPAVILIVTFAMQALELQVERLNLVYQASQEARAAGRGEYVSSARIEGNLICVEKAATKLITIKEKQCARRLGL